MVKIFYFLIRHRRSLFFGSICTGLLKLLGLEIPNKVITGNNLKFPHLGGCIVIHPSTEIRDNVEIYHGVTIGRADVYNTWADSKMEKIIIEDGAILGAGSKILCKNGTLKVGKSSIIAANSVLLNSTGDNEIWAGNPAKKVSIRRSKLCGK